MSVFPFLKFLEKITMKLSVIFKVYLFLRTNSSKYSIKMLLYQYYSLRLALLSFMTALSLVHTQPRMDISTSGKTILRRYFSVQFVLFDLCKTCVGISCGYNRRVITHNEVLSHH